MATIDNDGIQLIKQKLKNPLESIASKLEKAGVMGQVTEEYDLMYRFFDDIDKWNRPNMQPEHQVVIDGLIYKKVGERG